MLKCETLIDELINNSIIRESTSPYDSPLLLVTKKDISYRMCVDFRELNAHIVKDRFLFPRINNNQLDRLGRGKFFTSLDMASGFYQNLSILIHKTAFVTPNSHYEYLRMPFGLANASAVFQRSIDAALDLFVAH